MRRMTWHVPGFRRAGHLVLGALLLAAVASCGGDDDPFGPIPTSANQAVGTKLAALAIAIATGAEGRGPLDNFIGCSLRGVIDYSNIPTGRRATVSGCNLNDGVVADGSIELRWIATPGGARMPIGRIELLGPITVKVGDTTRVVPSAVIENITFTDPSQPSLYNARLDQVRVTVLGEVISLDRRALVQNVFGPFPLTMNSIPNAQGGPAGLTDVDARRLALQLGTTFLAILSEEAGATPFRYNTGCGVIDVARNADSTTNRITFSLVPCDFGNGLLVGGEFVMNEADADLSETRGAYRVTGSLTVGGGVPRTTLTAFEWSTDFPGGLPSDATITMTLVAENDRWEYSYTVPIDD